MVVVVAEEEVPLVGEESLYKRPSVSACCIVCDHFEFETVDQAGVGCYPPSSSSL
jgi:hypothetical protein